MPETSAPGFSINAKTYLLLAFATISNAAGTVLIGAGMKQVGELDVRTAGGLIGVLGQAFTNTTMWVGVMMLLVFLVCYLVLLSLADYTYVEPLSAIGYALIALMARGFLGEDVSSIRWIGIVLICMGAAFVGRTAPCTVERGHVCS